MDSILKKYNYFIRKSKYLFVGLIICCSTYYYANKKFNNLFEKNQLEKAQEILNKNAKKKSKGKNRFLFFLDNGIISHHRGKYKKSNEYLEKAYKIKLNIKYNPGKQALSYIFNPTITNYKGEDHEGILIHYFKCLNYLFLNDKESALIECIKMDKELRRLKTKYKSKAKYSQDAFLHLLMGIIYETNEEYNDAFIAYRTAYKIFETFYKYKLNIQTPIQLKKDLIIMAKKNFFYDEQKFYENKFKIKYNDIKNEYQTNLICFWNNGLSPYKEELSINFFIVPGVGGLVYFKNKEMGLDFAFPLPPIGAPELTSMGFIRVVWPKYKERIPYYTSGKIIIDDNKIFCFEKVEDINKIACLALKQRMVWEMSKTLLRIAIKKSIEFGLSKQNKILGFTAGIFNILTEKADTRSCHTLPHSIYYAKIPLNSKSKVILELSEKKNANTIDIDMSKLNKKWVFCSINSFQNVMSISNNFKK